MADMKEAVKDRETASPDLIIATYHDTENIQDFLEAFEGIMNIHNIAINSWVEKRRARTVCTDMGTFSTYEEVKMKI